MNTALPRIYLASRSPRRRELLAQVGIPFDVLLFRSGQREDAEIDESVLPGESPDDYVVRVARAKAVFGQQVITLRRLLPRLVLSADTTVDVGGDIVGKPRDEEAARAVLRRLSGATHRVLTAVAVAEGSFVRHVLNVSDVRFRSLDEPEIRRYVSSGEPMDKAGAYGIQGRAGAFVEEIRGSHSGIVGLPLCDTVMLLRQAGYPA